MKYPWDDDKQIDWSKSWQEITVDYQDKYFKANKSLIDYYFTSKLWKMGCIAGWVIALTFAYCLFVVTP